MRTEPSWDTCKGRETRPRVQLSPWQAVDGQDTGSNVAVEQERIRNHREATHTLKPRAVTISSRTRRILPGPGASFRSAESCRATTTAMPMRSRSVRRAAVWSDPTLKGLIHGTRQEERHGAAKDNVWQNCRTPMPRPTERRRAGAERLFVCHVLRPPSSVWSIDDPDRSPGSVTRAWPSLTRLILSTND